MNKKYAEGQEVYKLVFGGDSISIGKYKIELIDSPFVTLSTLSDEKETESTIYFHNSVFETDFHETKEAALTSMIIDIDKEMDEMKAELDELKSLRAQLIALFRKESDDA